MIEVPGAGTPEVDKASDEIVQQAIETNALVFVQMLPNLLERFLKLHQQNPGSDTEETFTKARSQLIAEAEEINTIDTAAISLDDLVEDADSAYTRENDAYLSNPELYDACLNLARILIDN